MRRLPLLLASLVLAGCATGGDRPEESTDLPVKVVTVPSHTVFSLAVEGPYAGIEEQIDHFLDALEQKGILPVGDLQAAFYDDPKAVDATRTRYEIRIPVEPGTRATAPYRVKDVPEQRTATVLMKGPYNEISALYPQLYGWVAKNGFEPDGPLLEVYLVHPGSGVPPTRYETEVHVPVRERK